MLGKVFGIMCVISIVYGGINGTLGDVGDAVFEGAESAITLTLSLSGIMCLWCGVMNVLRCSGAIGLLAKLLSPIIRIFFPEGSKNKECLEDISAGIGANLLGIGNAATPLALSAVEKLQREYVKNGGREDTASGDVITLAVLNTAAANLLPTTIIALRRGAGSERPFAVVAPIWICSVCSAFLALILTRACGMTSGKGRK